MKTKIIMKTKMLSVAALSALLFAACGNDDANETPEVNDRMVRFSSGIQASAESSLRIGGDDGDMWSAYDHIGIFMLENGQPIAAENIVDGAANMKYRAKTAVKSTEFTVASGSDDIIYYPINGPMVDFFAYYPYQASLTNFSYPIDLANQAAQADLYLLTSQRADNGGSGFDKTNTAPVNFVFDHHLVKVVINVSRGNITDLSGLEVNIKGMNTKADFSLVNKVLSNENTVSDLTPYRNGTGSPYVYEAVLLPVVLDASHVVEFTVNGETFTWTMSDNTGNIDKLKGAKKYTFNVSLNKAKMEASGTITPWTTVPGSNGVAK